MLSFYVSTVQSFEVSTENAGVKYFKYIHIYYYTHAENTLMLYIAVYKARDTKKILIIVSREKGRRPYTTATVYSQLNSTVYSVHNTRQKDIIIIIQRGVVLLIAVCSYYYYVYIIYTGLEN